MRTRLVVAAALALVAVGTLCLGGAWAGSRSASTAGSLPSGKRLTTRQWRAFERSYKAFTKTTQGAVTTFRRCRTTTTYAQSATALSRCLGKSLEAALGVAETLQNTLKSFHGTVGSVCNKGFGSYVGALHIWRSTLSALQTVSHQNHVSGIDSALDRATTQAPRVAAAERAYSRVCAPV